MKKVIFLMLLAVLFSAASANALLLMDEDFSGATISGAYTLSPSSNTGMWLGFRWEITDDGSGGSGDYFAAHPVQSSDNTNLLYYGIVTPFDTTGATFSLDLDYITSNRNGTVYLAGMIDGVDQLDPFAPWFVGDADDPTALLQESLSTTSSWLPASFSGQFTENYDAIVLAFSMGGVTGDRGVDNILLDVTAAPVPEPATLLLLGTGLIGLVGAGRKKIFRK